MRQHYYPVETLDNFLPQDQILSYSMKQNLFQLKLQQFLARVALEPTQEQSGKKPGYGT